MNEISSPSANKFAAASFFAYLAPFVSVIRPGFLCCQKYDETRNPLWDREDRSFHHLQQLYTSGKAFPFDSIIP